MAKVVSSSPRAPYASEAKPVSLAKAASDTSQGATLAPAVGHERTMRICPRCAATLFADMDVCYECLYDFSRDSSRRNTRNTRNTPRFSELPAVDGCCETPSSPDFTSRGH